MPSLPPRLWTELFFDSAWNPITRDLRQTSSVKFARGLTSESASKAAPTRAEAVLDSRDNKYGPRNPNSPLFGKIGRNTPMRIGYFVGSPWAEMPGSTGNRLSTPDDAAFAVTDLDMRVEVALDDWNVVSSIVGRYVTTGDNRSFALLTTASGRLQFTWSPDGTFASLITTSSTESVQAYNGQRIAVRVTLDVNNGAGGYELRFYIGRTVDDDEWSLFGDPIIGGSTTSIFDGTAGIELGHVNNFAVDGITGKLFAFKLFDGIGTAGVTAASMFTSDAGPGASSFTSGGLVWTVENNAELSNKHIRISGEVPEWPPTRDLSGNNTTVAVAPTGITRRIDAGAKPLDSPMFREMTNPARENIVAYWSCEDATGSESIASGIVDGLPMEINGTLQLASFTEWPGSDALPAFPSGDGVALIGAVQPYVNTNETSLRFMMAVPEDGVAAGGQLAEIRGTGSVKQWEISVSSAGDLTLVARDSDGTALVNETSAFAVNGQRVALLLELTQDGADIDWRLREQDYSNIKFIDESVPQTSISNTLSSNTVGVINSVIVGGDSALDGTSIGHVALADALAAYTNTASAQLGWRGESTGNRIERLAEEGGFVATPSSIGTQQEVGTQRLKKRLGLMNEAALTGFGYLLDARDRAEVIFRSGTTLWNQPPALTLDFEAGLISPPFQPRDDDKLTENDVTIKREDGSKRRQVLESGELSVQDFPNGVGRYDKEYTYSLRTDDQADQVAFMRLHLGTFNGVRYSRITLNLANDRVFQFIDDILRIDVGDKLRLTNVPDDHGPDDVDVLVNGYTEEAGPQGWEITFNCVPAEPWTAGVVDSFTRGRADTASSELAAALTADDTEMQVLTTATALWTADPFDSPYDLRTGGEGVRVTAPHTLLNVNPFFDTDTTGWTESNASISVSTAPGRVFPDPVAVASLFIAPDGVSSSGGANGDLTAVGTITPGAQYVVSLWAFSAGGFSDLQPAVNWFEADGSFISSGFGAGFSVPAGEWTYLTQTLTAPALASRASMRARHGSTPSAAQTWHAWAVRLTRVKASASYDDFGRTESSGWGAADSGAAWTNTGGADADYAVGSGHGSHTLATLGVSRRTSLVAVSADCDIYCDVATDVLATGNSLFGSLMARHADVDNLYTARIQFLTTQAIVLTLRKRVTGTETELDAFTTTLTHVAGTFYRLRFQVIGSELKAKIWPVAETEPAAFQVEATDTDLTAAESWGCRSITFTGNTNTDPEIRYDNFDVVNPQTFTVTRSVNGVSKAQASGEDVRLARPVYVAL